MRQFLAGAVMSFLVSVGAVHASDPDLSPAWDLDTALSAMVLKEERGYAFHAFEVMEGAIDVYGTVDIDIHLNAFRRGTPMSVIHERFVAMDGFEHPTARLSMPLDRGTLMQLLSGATTPTTLPMTLTLNGIEREYVAKVSGETQGDGSLIVTSAVLVPLSLATFDLPVDEATSSMELAFSFAFSPNANGGVLKPRDTFVAADVTPQAIVTATLRPQLRPAKSVQPAPRVVAAAPVKAKAKPKVAKASREKQLVQVTHTLRAETSRDDCIADTSRVARLNTTYMTVGSTRQRSPSYAKSMFNQIASGLKPCRN